MRDVTAASSALGSQPKNQGPLQPNNSSIPKGQSKADLALRLATRCLWSCLFFLSPLLFLLYVVSISWTGKLVRTDGIPGSCFFLSHTGCNAVGEIPPSFVGQIHALPSQKDYNTLLQVEWLKQWKLIFSSFGDESSQIKSQSPSGYPKGNPFSISTCVGPRCVLGYIG